MKQLLLVLALTFSFQALAQIEIEIGDKQLFGNYLRQQITDASKAPFSFVGKIGMSCTGTLVGPRHVITAGHCVYDLPSRSWMMNLTFTPRQVENGEYPFGTIKWKRVFVQKEFIEKADVDYDFAIVELEEPIGDKIGWAGIQPITNETSLKKIRITGYPQDEILDTMWTVTCPATIKGTQFSYKCDTYNGMSGSSIFSAKAAGAQEMISGIHSYGTNDYNGGVILNQNNFNIITAWKNGSNFSANTLVHNKNDPSR